MAAFAFELDHGVVDTNTARVLARWAGRSLTAEEAQAAADAAVPAGRGLGLEPGAARPRGDGLRQAVTALRGVPGRPTRCAWLAAGRPDPDPGRRLGRRVAGARPGSRAATARAAAGSWRRWRSGPVAAADLATTMGWPDDPDRADRVAATLVADGLAQVTPRGYALPVSPNLALRWSLR